MQIKADFKEFQVTYQGTEIKFPFYKYQFALGQQGGLAPDAPEHETRLAAVAAARSVCEGVAVLGDDDIFAIICGVVAKVEDLGNAPEQPPTS